MDRSAQTDRQKLIESLTAFLANESSRAGQRFCPLCGAVMQSFGATLWVSGTDRGWTVRLPFCTCQQKKKLPE
jgi:hypothetical protein